MLNAWKNYRRYNISFAEALHRAWLSAKAEEINAERIKRSKEAADVTEDKILGLDGKSSDMR